MDETKINIPQQQVAPVQSYARVLSTFEKVKDVLSSVALLSGIAYGIYVFYKVSRVMLNFDRVFFNLFAAIYSNNTEVHRTIPVWT